jgi:hypothetical protein
MGGRLDAIALARTALPPGKFAIASRTAAGELLRIPV